jgi:hypothetical protein
MPGYRLGEDLAGTVVVDKAADNIGVVAGNILPEEPRPQKVPMRNRDIVNVHWGSVSPGNTCLQHVR